MKFHRTSRIYTAIVLVALAGSAVAGASDVLTSKSGRTLYTFDKDSAGKSVCHDSCLTLWPAVSAAEAPAANDNWGSIGREDGSPQLTYKGKPVYYYVQDKAPGDANGDKFGGVWHVIHKNASTASDDRGGYYRGGYSY